MSSAFVLQFLTAALAWRFRVDPYRWLVGWVVVTDAMHWALRGIHELWPAPWMQVAADAIKLSWAAAHLASAGFPGSAAGFYAFGLFAMGAAWRDVPLRNGLTAAFVVASVVAWSWRMFRRPRGSLMSFGEAPCVASTVVYVMQLTARRGLYLIGVGVFHALTSAAIITRSRPWQTEPAEIFNQRRDSSSGSVGSLRSTATSS